LESVLLKVLKFASRIRDTDINPIINDHLLIAD